MWHKYKHESYTFCRFSCSYLRERGNVWSSSSTLSVTINANNTSLTFFRGLGGLVGRNEGTIRNSYATGGISSSGNNSQYNLAGGLVGLNAGTIRNSYAAVGTVNPGNGANDRAGSLVGLNLNTVQPSETRYSTCNIDGAGPYDYGRGHVRA